MATQLPSLYYLTHFQSVLKWLSTRYSDLLRLDDLRFIADFNALSPDAQALLVRCVIRRHEPLRWSTFQYAEINDHERALSQLVALAWIDANPLLSTTDLLRLAKKDELLSAPWASHFAKSTSKAQLAKWLMAQPGQSQQWATWLPEHSDRVIAFKEQARMDRFRLMFFGNLYQDWSEFVVTDLGHQRFESVMLDAHSRAFHDEREIAAAHKLHDLGMRIATDENLYPLFDELRKAIDGVPDFLEARRHKRLFQLGAAAERQKDWALASAIYAVCRYPGKTYRAVRVCEKLAEHECAYALATGALGESVRGDERQALMRTLPRLAKKLSLPMPPKPIQPAITELALHLAEPPTRGVELSACEALATDTLSVHYVENTLLCGLLGLLFWEVVFAPISGVFFNPYQRGPADLFHPEFATRRTSQIDRCIEYLNTGSYHDVVLHTWQKKQGLQNPFVVWPALNEALIRQALAIIPAHHLHVIFKRMLDDLRQHSSGLPDLIAFDTSSREPAYRLIEVKSPNDKLQDNQVRWFEFFAMHDMPAQVLHVNWPSK